MACCSIHAMFSVAAWIVVVLECAKHAAAQPEGSSLNLAADKKAVFIDYENSTAAECKKLFDASPTISR